MKENDFGMYRPLPGVGYDDAVERVEAALQKEGFGILTVIDMKATLKAKLDKDMRSYRILGACNPVLAHQAITAVSEIGLLLPCNVLVREDDEGQVNVSFMDPGAVLGLVNNSDVVALAGQVKAKLEKVLAAL